MGIKKFALIIVIIFSIAIFIAQAYVSFVYCNILPLHLSLLYFAILFIYLFFVLYSLFNTKRIKYLKDRLEQCEKKNQSLTILNDDVRGFKHDFNNIITTIGGYVQADDITGLKKYYNEIAVDCKKINNLVILNSSIINEPAIYSLISNKYFLASENGINVNLDVSLDLKSINMKIYEFTRILGILFDNAIEASKECSEKVINICIRKDLVSPRQVLIIENTYNNKDVDIETIYKKGVSSKPKNTGIGLWEVRQIINRNSNLNLYTTKDDKFFKQQLEIYNS